MAVVQLIISITPEGKISVNGPIDQPLLAYGLLECARDVIKNHNEQKTNAIQPASPNDVLAINRKVQ